MVGELIEVILYVDDMAAGVTFYRDRLGLRIAYPQREDYAAELWVQFDTGACRLCLHGGGSRKQGADAAKIVFRVADIHLTQAELRERGVELGEVRSPSPGVLVCDGVDPAGNRFSIEQS